MIGTHIKKEPCLRHGSSNDLVAKAGSWLSGLPPREQQRIGPLDMEASVLAYMESNPKEVTVKDYEKAVGRDGFNPYPG